MTRPELIARLSCLTSLLVRLESWTSSECSGPAAECDDYVIARSLISLATKSLEAAMAALSRGPAEREVQS